MGGSASSVNIQDKISARQASVVATTDVPTLNGLVITNPDGSSIGSSFPTTYLKLDQTAPQTIINGIPLLTGLTPTTDYQIATKKYVDDSVSVENLWDRVGTVLSPHTAGDDITTTGTGTFGNSSTFAAGDASGYLSFEATGSAKMVAADLFMTDNEAKVYFGDNAGDHNPMAYIGMPGYGGALTIKSNNRGTGGIIVETGADILNTIPAAGQFIINGAAQTQTDGLLNVNTTTATTGVIGGNFSLTNTHNQGTTTYGLKSDWVSTTAVTGGANTAYGFYNVLTKTGADSTASDTNFYASYNTASYTGGNDVGTIRNTFGGYFSATGDTAGTSTTYGIYASATGGDVNYAGYFSGNVNITGNIGTALTAGSVVFSDGTNLAQDNANFFWDNTNKRLGIGTATPAYALDVKGLTAESAIRSDIGFDIYQVPNPTGLSGVLNAGTELGIGVYRYYVLYLTDVGQTAKSNLLTITTTAGNQRVLLTVPVSTDPRVTGRKLWRTKVNGAYYGTYHLVTISDNTTTEYLDVIPDADLTGTSMGYGVYNSTTNYVSLNGTPTFVVDENFVGLGATGLPLYGAWNTLIGYLAGSSMTGLSTTGNTCIGYRAGVSLTGHANLCIGYNAGGSSVSNNVCLGFNAGAGGTANIAIGRQALGVVASTGLNNVGIGQYAGLAITTGDNNVFIGYGAGQTGQLATAINSMGLGNGAVTTASNQIVIGNDDITETLLKGSVGINITPTAKLHLQAGTATINTAPLKFTSGELLTNPEPGAVEYNLDDYYASISTGTSYYSQYPPAQDDTYVKATTQYSTSYVPYFATDPAKSLTGSWATGAWLSSNGTYTNQRFHIDLGSAKTITKVYYENVHNTGVNTANGVRNFTLWGSNTASSFAELTYGTDTGWTQLTTDVAEFDQHVALNQADPKYVVVTNTTPYRYYAFKFADNWGTANYMGVRRIELQATAARKKVVLDNGTDLVSGRIPYAFTNGRLIDSANFTFDGTDLTIPATLITDKLKFTQTDGNEYIDSLADGYMDYGATTGHRFGSDIFLNGDGRKVCFGTDGAADSYIQYDGSELDILSATDINLEPAANLQINGVSGWTGTFTEHTGKTVTVSKGIITGVA